MNYPEGIPEKFKFGQEREALQEIKAGDSVIEWQGGGGWDGRTSVATVTRVTKTLITVGEAPYERRYRHMDGNLPGDGLYRGRIHPLSKRGLDAVHGGILKAQAGGTVNEIEALLNKGIPAMGDGIEADEKMVAALAEVRDHMKALFPEED